MKKKLASFDEATISQLYFLYYSGKTYTAEEMENLLSGLTEDLESSMVELMYLYAESSQNADPEWTMTTEELFNYLVDVVIVDERFCDLLDEDAKVALSEETYSFISDLASLCDDKLTGDYYFVGNSAMNYEMAQTFDGELLFITILTAVVIYIIVAIVLILFILPGVLACCDKLIIKKEKKA